MRSHRLAVMWLGLGVLAACDGHPVHPDAPGDAPPGDAPPVTCAPPGEICDGVCVNLAESPTSCGRCGHDCGGGACAAGKCQPVLVAGPAAGLDAPAALAVNATAIFWTERTRIRSCPLPLGCALEPRLIADVYSRLEAIAVTEEAVYFTGCRACDDHHDLRRCPVAGCPEPAPPVMFTAASLGEILIGSTHAYWHASTDALFGCAHADCAGTLARWSFVDLGGELIATTIDGATVYAKPAGAELRACPEAAGCDAPEILPNSLAIAPPFRVHDGVAYWLVEGPTTGLVRACAVADCGFGATFAADNRGSTELEVDDTGVYWLNPSAGTLRHCPRTGCPPGGAAVLASGRTGPKELTLGAGFVYWIEGNTLLKLAKP